MFERRDDVEQSEFFDFIRMIDGQAMRDPAAPVVTGNRLSATAAPAMLLDTGALGQYRENRISSAERPGIVVSASAPIIEANTVEATGMAGIVFDAGKATGAE